MYLSCSENFSEGGFGCRGSRLTWTIKNAESRVFLRGFGKGLDKEMGMSGLGLRPKWKVSFLSGFVRPIDLRLGNTYCVFDKIFCVSFNRLCVYSRQPHSVDRFVDGVQKNS